MLPYYEKQKYTYVCQHLHCQKDIVTLKCFLKVSYFLSSESLHCPAGLWCLLCSAEPIPCSAQGSLAAHPVSCH